MIVLAGSAAGCSYGCGVMLLRAHLGTEWAEVGKEGKQLRRAKEQDGREQEASNEGDETRSGAASSAWMSWRRVGRGVGRGWLRMACENDVESGAQK